MERGRRSPLRFNWFRFPAFEVVLEAVIEFCYVWSRKRFFSGRSYGLFSLLQCFTYLLLKPTYLFFVNLKFWLRLLIFIVLKLYYRMNNSFYKFQQLNVN